MQVLFLPRYGPLAGSSRYMSYDYLPYYEAAGINCTIIPLLDDHYLKESRAVQSKKHVLGKLSMYIFKRAIKRIKHIFRTWSYDIIVLEKDLIPYFPYFIEHFLFSAKKKVIMMLDEPTYTFYNTHPNKLLRTLAKNKIERIMKKSSHIIAWNQDVEKYAHTQNRYVTAVNTGIDLDRYQTKTSYEVTERPFRIGWIGSPSGYIYLHDLDSVIANLAKEYNVELYVVSSDAYKAEGFPVINRPWSVKTEVDDLLTMDIGLMPLQDNEWASSKSGCKMFQYMGTGLPVVVSPVGIPNQVIQDSINGLIAQTKDEWHSQLSKLIKNPQLRERLGRAGRKYIEENNSQASVAKTLIQVLFRVARGS